MTNPEIQGDDRERKEQNERLDAIKGVSSKLSDLRAAIEGGASQTVEKKDGPTPKEALQSLHEAFIKYRSDYVTGTPEADDKAWKAFEQAMVGSEGATSVENLARGLLDSADKTAVLRDDLANLSGQLGDEQLAAGEYLKNFGQVSAGTKIDEAEAKFRNSAIGKSMEGLFGKIGIKFEDVMKLIKGILFGRFEKFPVHIQSVEDFRFNQEKLKIASFPSEQKRGIEIKWRSAYKNWSSDPTKVIGKHPRIEVKGTVAKVVEPALQKEQVAEKPKEEDLFKVKGWRINQPLAMSANSEITVPVGGKDVVIRKDEIERGKKFKLEDKKDKKPIEVITLTSTDKDDAGKINVLISTGETIQLAKLVGNLDKAKVKEGEASIEFPVSTSRDVRASAKV